MNIHGHTKITGLIGDPITHSLSYAIHNDALKKLEIEACYLPFPAPNQHALKNLVSMMRTPALVGANVTIPHKQQVMPLLDSIDQHAQQIGAVNTIVKTPQGKLIGKNSDAEGFLHSLHHASIPYRRRHIFLIGAGGAARAVAMILAPHVSSITVWNRTPATADQLIADLKNHSSAPAIPYAFCHHPEQYQLPPHSLLVQCTPVGQDDELPPHPKIDNSHTVIDLLYRYTPLLHKAKAAGARILDGSSMLIHQAALSFSWWFSVAPPIAIMRASLYPQRTIV